MPYESALLSTQVYLGVLHHGISWLDQDYIAAYRARVSLACESRDDLRLTIGAVWVTLRNDSWRCSQPG